MVLLLDITGIEHTGEECEAKQVDVLQQENTIYNLHTTFTLLYESISENIIICASLSLKGVLMKISNIQF